MYDLINSFHGFEFPNDVLNIRTSHPTFGFQSSSS